MGGAAFLRQREATVLVVTIALIIYFAVDSSNFLGSSNLTTWLSEDAAPIIIIAIGEVLLLICGEIDLSVGFVYTLSPFLMHYLIDFYHVPGILAIIISLLMGLAVGWVNAFLTVTVGLPSFITTLGTGFILLGIVDTTSHAEPATIDPTAGGYQPMFYSVTAAVIGGTAMLGGVGTILGAFLGAVVLATLTDGFSIIGISANPLDIVFCGAILVAMIANVQLAKLREAGRS
jgi:ribose/xylose/arabinose/galactoside ABC-type transport system permease subunit